MAEPAYSKRIAKALAALAEVPDPLARLDAIRRVREAVERLEQEAAEAARADGATWKRIGELYGVSKQAAQQRFRRPPAHAGAGDDPADPTPGNAVADTTG